MTEQKSVTPRKHFLENHDQVILWCLSQLLFPKTLLFAQNDRKVNF